MTFTCDKIALQKAVAAAGRAACSKSTIQALEGLLFDVSDDTLTVTGFDLKKAIYVKVPIADGKDGRCVINSKFINELMSRMPNGSIVFTTDDQGVIHVKCARSKVNISGLDVNDYPDMPTFTATDTVNIAQTDFRSLITKTVFASATEELRPQYTGELILMENGTITVVATDGYRLAIDSKPTNNTNAKIRCIVPATALLDVVKNCTGKSDNDMVQMQVADKHVCFQLNDITIISRRLEGDFVDFKRAVPNLFKYDMRANKNEIIAALKRASIVLDSVDSAVCVKFMIQNDTIQMSCVTATGTAEDSVTIETAVQEPLTIGFSAKYMLAALEAISDDTVAIRMNEATKPCVISGTDTDTETIQMVLPIRIH